MNKRFAVIFLTLILLMVSVFPVSAKTTRTVFTGTCYFMEEPPSPDVRDKYTDGNGYHIRNEVQLMDCIFSDPRLPQYVWLNVNWDVKFYFDSPVWIIGHDYGETTFKDASGNVFWDGMYNGFFDEEGNYQNMTILKGVGVNKGLQIQATATTDIFTWIVHMKGDIIDPGE